MRVLARNDLNYMEFHKVVKEQSISLPMCTIIYRSSSASSIGRFLNKFRWIFTNLHEFKKIITKYYKKNPKNSLFHKLISLFVYFESHRELTFTMIFRKLVNCYSRSNWLRCSLVSGWNAHLSVLTCSHFEVQADVAKLNLCDDYWDCLFDGSCLAAASCFVD